MQRAIIEGRDETGVSIMVLTAGMDEGPVLAEERVPIELEDTAGSLGERLAEIGAPLLVSTMRSYAAGEIEPREQNREAATYAPKIKTDEARIDWTASASRVHDLVRGLNPVPGAWSILRGKRVKVHRVRATDTSAPLEPGEVVADGALLVGTGEGGLELVEVQMEGRKRMTGIELARGLRLEDHEMFEAA